MKPDPDITDEGKLMTTPSTAAVGLRAFRIPEDLYKAAMAVAVRNGEPLTDVVRRALRDYVRANRES